MWSCYLIADEKSNRTYVGVSTDVKRRVSEHGKTAKSAKYTRGSDWQLLLYVTGFPSRSIVQKFETTWKRHRNAHCLDFAGHSIPPTWQRRLAGLKLVLTLFRHKYPGIPFQISPVHPAIVNLANLF